MKQFAHLHVHTEFSLLDGAVRIDKVFELCDELNIPAIAITDHGNMYGVIKFLQAAVRHTDFRADFFDFMAERRSFKVKPIIGGEVCMTDNMGVREKGKDNVPPKFYHLVLLAKNEAGYHNLIKIVSEGYAEGTYDNPHVDFEFIKAHSEGLIALSACLAGVIPQAILENDFALADAWIKKFKYVFGDDFYVEIQNHDMDKQKIVLPHLIRLAKENSVKVVATNNAHYSTKADSETQKVLLAIFDYSVSGNADVGVDMSGNNFFLTDEFYIKNYDEMYAALPYEDALAASLEIAEKCDPYLIKKEQLLPSYMPPNGMNAERFLRKLTFDGLKLRYGEITAEIKTRAEYELGIIEKRKFTDYFLTVWNFVHYAKTHNIPVGPGEGGDVGSVVMYALGITKIDPLKYNLIFERFVNPEYIANPAFYIELGKDKRDEIMEYLMKKYGATNVSKIATFGRFSASIAIKIVGCVYNYPDSEIVKITRLIPMMESRLAESYYLTCILGQAEWKYGVSENEIRKSDFDELKDMYKNDEKVRTILDMAMKIEGMPQKIGVRYAGVVICRDPIADHVPLVRTN